ncbi:TatD family hydrolase [Demequina sp.]|uniref:TatD family hydrolase n=1 Tax=Demequina sp. TaxID=2050685 RepID=UPI003D1402BB
MPSGEWAPAPEPLPAPVVDNHTHLDWEQAENPRTTAQLLREAADAGVTKVVQIGCDVGAARWTVAAIDEHPAMVGGVALHPNDAARHALGTHASGLTYEDAFAQIAELARHPRIRVIGETGLDRFRTGSEGIEAQERAFRDHLALARELDLPVQIHDRDAHADVLRVVDADTAPRAVIMHCFSGDAGFARECLDRGWYLSFAGTVTFKNAPGLREAAALTPRDRLLVETDAPFLTPHPHRGAVNAPAQVATTVRTLAQARGDDLDALCVDIAANSESLYGPW